MNRPFAAFLALSLLAFVPLGHADQPGGPTIDDDIAILRALHADRCAGDSPLIITDRPIALAADAGMRRPRREFGIEMASRSPPGTFWPLVELCPAVRVVNHLRLERFLDGPGRLPKDFAGLEREYGVNSYEQVSMPAYSADGLRAVVVTEYVCPECGHGGTYLFLKTAGRWKLIDSRTDWMS